MFLLLPPPSAYSCAVPLRGLFMLLLAPIVIIAVAGFSLANMDGARVTANAIRLSVDDQPLPAAKAIVVVSISRFRRYRNLGIDALAPCSAGAIARLLAIVILRYHGGNRRRSHGGRHRALR